MTKPEVFAWQKTGSFCVALTNDYIYCHRHVI